MDLLEKPHPLHLPSSIVDSTYGSQRRNMLPSFIHTSKLTNSAKSHLLLRTAEWHPSYSGESCGRCSLPHHKWRHTAKTPNLSSEGSILDWTIKQLRELETGPNLGLNVEWKRRRKRESKPGQQNNARQTTQKPKSICWKDMILCETWRVRNQNIFGTSRSSP